MVFFRVFSFNLCQLTDNFTVFSEPVLVVELDGGELFAQHVPGAYQASGQNVVVQPSPPHPARLARANVVP